MARIMQPKVGFTQLFIRVYLLYCVEQIGIILAIFPCRFIISWNDFKNPRARKLMKRYLDDKKHLDGQLATLEKMRRQYRDGDTSLKTTG